MPSLQDSLSFSRLMIFMDICQTRSVSETAQRLGFSKAHISLQLKQLEAQLGLQLLVRDNGSLFVNEQGLSIGKTIYRLANLCCFADSACRVSQDWQCVNVSIPLRFWGGGISRALTFAVSALRQHYPHILFNCEFVDDDSYQYRNSQWLPECGVLGNISIFYSNEASDIAGQWCVLDNGRDSNNPQLIVPKMPWGVMREIVPLLEAQQIHFSYSERDYTQWLASPLADNQAILSHEFLLTYALTRLHRKQAYPLTSALYLHCHTSHYHPALALFCQYFQSAFHSADIALRPWGQIISAKQWRYFAQLIKHGSFGRAAESLFITQPALSKQIGLLEKQLQTELWQRNQQYVLPSKKGAMLANMAEGIAITLEDLSHQVHERRFRERKELTIGILPSVDNRSHLIDIVMEHIETWHQAHQDISIHIYEAAHHRLVELLRAQDIQLAITEADSPWLNQLPIFRAEALGLIAPSSWFEQAVPTQMAWQDLHQYPLVLLRNTTGIRQLINQQCLHLSIRLMPEVESDSLNLNRRWIDKQRYATILPASAAVSLLNQGSAVFIPLIPTVKRQLKISYLRNRVLNQDEQSLMQALIQASQA